MKHLILLLALITLPITAETITLKNGESISKAMISARRGDTLFLEAGTYKESISMIDGIVIRGEHALTTIIKGNNRESTVKLNGTSSIENVTITAGQNGVECQSGRAKIAHCIIRGNRGSGILAVKSLPEIIHTVISHNGGNGIKGTTIAGGSLILDSLTIAQNSEYGIDIASTEPVAISNSIFYKNGLKAFNDQNNQIIATNNVIFPEQKAYSTNNRTVKPIFLNDKNARPLFKQADNSPGKGVGAIINQ